MEFSSTLKKKASAIGAPLPYLIMSDLMAIGYSETDAYLIAYPNAAASSPQGAMSSINNITNSERFKKLKAHSRDRIKEGFRIKSETDNIDLISSDEVAREVLLAAKHQPQGSKERADLFIKYQEMMRKNDVSDDVTEDTIQFYLPLCCDLCPLLIAHKEKAKE